MSLFKLQNACLFANLHQADEIFIQAIKDAGIYDEIRQAFTALLRLLSLEILFKLLNHTKGAVRGHLDTVIRGSLLLSKLSDGCCNGVLGLAVKVCFSCYLEGVWKMLQYGVWLLFLALGWILEEIDVTWGSFGEETDKITDLQQISRSLLQTVAEDGVTGIKRRRRDLSSDGVRNRRRRDTNPIRTLGYYSKPSHEGYINTIELPVGSNVVPIRSDTIRLVQNGCSFHGIRSEDPNQHLKDFLKLMDSFDLDGSITTWEDLTTRFLAQFFPPGRTTKLCNDILMFQLGLSMADPKPTWTEKPDRPDTNQTEPKDSRSGLGLGFWTISVFVKAISLPQDVSSTFDHRLMELENQIQCLMEAHIAPTQPTQVNKITTLCEICSGPHDTQYCMEDPKQAFIEYASSRIDEAGVEEEKREREGDPGDTNTIAYIEERRDTPLLERKDITAVDNLGSNKDDEGIGWLDVEEPLDLVNTSEESVYELLIKETPKWSLNYDFKIKKGDPRNLKIPCMIEITFKTPYKDPERSELSSEGHDLLPSRVILSEDDYDRGCRKPSDLEEGFYKDTIKLGPEYVTRMDDAGEVT
uniref:MAK10-like protein n=1 Tax=Tanacetum cinerariifolium TaxID=118510 RepID=A0A6L2N669_TANCI|nr:MAK10-like protein [Tanacetum cinerariifolium]